MTPSRSPGSKSPCPMKCTTCVSERRSQVPSSESVALGSRSSTTRPVEVRGSRASWIRRPLGLDVELVEVDRRGDDRQHAQRSVDRDRSRYLRHVEEPHQRRALRLRQEVVGPGVVQQLPRQPGDRRRVVEPEAEAQPAGLLGPYLVQAALPGQGEVAGEHRLVERTAEVHRGLLLARTSDPARARPPRVELEEEVLERGRVEGQLEPDAGGLAERGVGDARLVAAFSLLLQEQVEVEVAPGCHQLRSFACSVRTPD